MKIARCCFVILLMSFVAFGCAKKRDDVSSISGLDIEGGGQDVVSQTITTPEPMPQEPAAATGPAASAAKAPQASESIPLPSAGMERNRQIQTALKNANLYIGEIDGKAGPLTRKAIEEFQKMKGLKADGKVGPVTWAELQKYLNFAPAPTVPSNAKPKEKREI